MKLIAILPVPGMVAVGHAQTSPEPLSLAEVNRAMKTMMTDMSIAPTGDVDADSVVGMTPHHRGAVEMAKARLRYDRNELLRRIAQEIIVGQPQEIEAMRLALADGSVAVAGGPSQVAPDTVAPLEPRHAR